jgi:hypothetical protein
MTGGEAAPVTVAAVRQEFGPDWELEEGRFCWSATRRPTPTLREIVVGRDLAHLAAKLRDEIDSQG